MNRCWDQRAALTLLDRGGAGGLVISVSHAHVDKAKIWVNIRKILPKI